MDHQRILYADDCPADVELMLCVLTGLGLGEAVAVVGDGEEALNYLLPRAAYAETRPEPPDFLLLDLKMPRMDGFEVWSLVKALPRLQALPVVVFSSPEAEAELCRCHEPGASAHEAIPAGEPEFGAVLESLSASWLRLDNRLRGLSSLQSERRANYSSH